jgi:hypothetical protein
MTSDLTGRAIWFFVTLPCMSCVIGHWLVTHLLAHTFSVSWKSRFVGRRVGRLSPPYLCIATPGNKVYVGATFRALRQLVD